MNTLKIFLNPLTDFGFKKIFGTPENKHLLIGFLNAFIPEHAARITDVQYLSTEHFGGNPLEKKVVFDLYCTDQDGGHFIIEMQRGKQNFFAERVFTYLCRIVSETAEKGDRRYSVPRIISFNILDFNAPEFSGRDNFFWRVQLKDDDNEIFMQKIAFYFVELSKFAARKKQGDFGSERERWLYLLKHIAEMTEEEAYAVANSEILRKFVSECRIEKLNTMEKKDYEKSILEYEDVREAIECERRDSLAEGEMAGMAKGIEKGIEKGQTKRNMEIVTNMLSKGFDIETIADITNLSMTEIYAIKQQTASL